MAGDMRNLTTLELRIQRQHGEPRVDLVAEGKQRGAGVAEQEPGMLLVPGEHLGDPVGPALRQSRRQPRLGTPARADTP
jgi:hypothetical protein